MKHLAISLAAVFLAVSLCGCGADEPAPAPKPESKADLTKYVDLYCNGEYEAALAEVDRVLAEHPDNTNAHAQRAMPLCELLRFEEAIKEYEWLIARDPNNAIAYVFMGFAYMAPDRQAESVAAFKQGAEVYEKKIKEVCKTSNPWANDSYMGAAVCLYFSGQKSQSLEMMDKALEAAGTNDDLREILLKTREALEADEIDHFVPEYVSKRKNSVAPPEQEPSKPAPRLKSH